MIPSPDMPASIRVALPGGVWLGEEDDAPSRREVVLRGVTAADEVALLDTAARAPAERATDLLARCLVDGDRIAPALSVGDREAVLLHLRRATISDTIEAILTCPSPVCGSRLELQLRTAQLLVEPYADIRREYDAAFDTQDGSYAVSFRLPTSGDLIDAAAIARDDPDRAASVILRRCVIRAARNGLGLETEALPPAVRSAVAAAMADRDPQAEIDLQLQCPACHFAFGIVFDVASFFLRELDDRASRLLTEVHALASHYHWSERDILQMPAWRRARYLQLVAGGAARGRPA